MSDLWVQSVDVGMPPEATRGHRSFKVHFHDFSSLDSTKGHEILSPTFNCFNRDWKLALYPGGCAEARDGMSSVDLEHLSADEIRVCFNFVVKDGAGNIVKQTESTSTFEKDSDTWGYPNFIKRSKLLEDDTLHHGTLTIEARLKLDESKSPVHFIPENALSQSISMLFFDKEDADVLFEVASPCGDIVEEFHAHRLLLKARAPDLARICDVCDTVAPITIQGVETQVFHQLLRYVYGLKVTADWKKDAKKLIDASDLYGVVGLKVEAEAWYVTFCNFTVDNAIEEFLYADAKSCPLLRESALNFIVKNSKEVIKSDSFEDLLLAKDTRKEVILAIATAESNEEDDSMTPINDLRMALHQKGMDVDGSREMLTSRLKK